MPVFETIKQLIPSPSGEYIAILTSHTVHVAILPDSSHLTLGDKSPLKLKAFHVGPSTHVLDQSPVATALWHPLGVQGNCLVTITVDAVARVWELDRDNRWSFNEPSLATDLKKLANASTSAEDLSPSKYGASKGFSPDSFEMEVASACFGGAGAEDEQGWASMTLWIAMQEGDIYALCPFLPTKWQPPATLVPKLSSCILARSATAEEGEAVNKSERRIASAQYTWISELNRQNKATFSVSADSTTYHRPTQSNAVPKLQGPFAFGADMDQMFEITDIYCIPAVEEEDGFSEDDYASNAEHASLSVGVVCVATRDNQVHVCLDVEGTDGRWLPSQKTAMSHHDDKKFPELLLVKSISLPSPSANAWSTFTADEQSRYALLITNSAGVSRLSMQDFANKLESELAGTYTTGSEFRIEMLVETVQLELEPVVEFPRALSDSDPVTTDTASRNVAAVLNLQDSDLGNFFLTVCDRQPHAATLETSNMQLLLEGDGAETIDDDDVSEMIGNESRPTYQPPQELWNESVLTATVQESMTGRSRRVLAEDVRLSPLTLQIIMDAHRVLSHETHRLGLAAADLFRRCERLQDEFKEQIRRANQASSRVDSLLDDADLDADTEVFSQADEPESQDGGTRGAIERRLETARTRQETLLERCAALRERTAGLDRHPLNEKERAWIGEITSFGKLVLSTSDADDGTGGDVEVDGPQPAPWRRLAEIERLQSELTARAEDVKQHDESQMMGQDGDEDEASVLSPERGRRQLSQIFSMLERESALVEATKAKVERLARMTV